MKEITMSLKMSDDDTYLINYNNPNDDNYIDVKLKIKDVINMSMEDLLIKVIEKYKEFLW